MPWSINYICPQYVEKVQSLNGEPTEHVLLFSIGEKKLYHFKAQFARAAYVATSSSYPVSCLKNSQGTPTGLHIVSEKYGDNAPPGTVFKGRVSTGQTYWECEDSGPQQKALVTTRILRLSGLEAGHNQGPGRDSFDRYIYIHGINHPERFPENQSAGCINLLDEDLIPLYKVIPVGTHVWIQEKPFS